MRGRKMSSAPTKVILLRKSKCSTKVGKPSKLSFPLCRRCREEEMLARLQPPVDEDEMLKRAMTSFLVPGGAVVTRDNQMICLQQGAVSIV